MFIPQGFLSQYRIKGSNHPCRGPRANILVKIQQADWVTARKQKLGVTFDKNGNMKKYSCKIHVISCKNTCNYHDSSLPSLPRTVDTVSQSESFIRRHLLVPAGAVTNGLGEELQRESRWEERKRAGQVPPLRPPWPREAARWWEAEARKSPAPFPQLGHVPRAGGGAAGPGGPRARRTARRSRDEASRDQHGPGCREEKKRVRVRSVRAPRRQLEEAGPGEQARDTERRGAGREPGACPPAAAPRACGAERRRAGPPGRTEKA